MNAIEEKIEFKSTSSEILKNNRPRELKSDEVLRNTMKINSKGNEDHLDTVHSNHNLNHKYNTQKYHADQKNILNSSFNHSKKEFSLPKLKKSYAHPESTKTTNRTFNKLTLDENLYDSLKSRNVYSTKSSNLN